MEITVSDQAINKLLEGGIGGETFLRLGVQPGGCAGMSYSAYADDILTEMDAVIYDEDGLRIAADHRYLHLIDGLSIDFSDDLIQPGFILKNPNAQHSCGCGASFKERETDEVTPCGGNCR
ncbi:HesB/IscA family protein [Tichowtungia aerotolerans]|uniref:Iron-sulfur cluster assembly accessory protein n=1 Tax=Tichowtungia aerotolerans TaxID=2697043 RepID=A0A6P1M7C1_9BACT|nr:iron-sulfur cluster assembly accessory protein [Tichowtungia aerotolerans]QHI69751.1 iron-sulfur cluster assembly accessory protein [Tichowtungia aerotolerans]